MQTETLSTNLELPNLVTILADKLKGTPLANYLLLFQNVIFSLIIILFIAILSFFASRKIALVPKGLQNLLEIFVEGTDNFVCGILGLKGRKYTPFIGTLFIYIILMNFMGFIPLLKSSTTSWSTTLALAICVFFYVQYTAFKELGFLGFLDHAAERPRGMIAYSVVIPVLMFLLYIISELVKPISLSLRLRSNIWGDDSLLAFLAGFGLKGLPLLIFNMMLALVADVVQAGVFCLLTTIYLALVMKQEE